jgi:predicted PurR-regulated permease PerM
MEQNDVQPVPTAWSPGRVALATLTVLAVVGAFLLFIEFRLVFFSLFIAIVLSTAFTPFVNRLERMGLPRTISIILISLAAILLVIVFILVVAPIMIEQWATITSLVNQWYRDLLRSMLDSPSMLVRRIASQFPIILPLSLPAPSNGEDPETQTVEFINQLLMIGQTVLRSVFTLGGVALLTGFWILEGERNTRILMLALRPDRRESVRTFLDEAEQKVGAYTRGLVYLSLIVGGLATIAYLIIGLPNVLLLGIIAGVMEAVPLVGPLLGAIPALAVALSFDPDKAIWVVGATVVIQVIENNFLVPRIMDRAVGVNPVVSLLAFLTFGSIFGFTGALLAIPLAAVIQLVLNSFVFRRRSAEQAPPLGRDAVSMLRYEAQNLVQDVRMLVREKEDEAEAEVDQVEDTMEAIMNDLDAILAQEEIRSNGEGNGK